MPYPVDYGGVFDLYYKIIALHAAGIHIHLHCFNDGNYEAPELNKYCQEINYYKRKKGIRGFSLSVPYIVYSRVNKKLNERLLKDDYPVLMEGIHCTGILNDNRFGSRRMILRLHNVEHKYYEQLYRSASSLFKTLYYLHESRLLQLYEKKIASRPSLTITVSEKDKDFYEHQLSADPVCYLPVFMGPTAAGGEPGTGSFCLYHGNLSVSENEKAVIWLLEKVFDDLGIPLVIAGKNPSGRLAVIIAAHPGSSLIADPSAEELQQLIKEAQCHVLPSFNNTGAKLKLINALFYGRHCIVNNAGVAGSELEQLCAVANTSQEFKIRITELFLIPVSVEDMMNRNTRLKKIFDPSSNAALLIKWIW